MQNKLNLLKKPNSKPTQSSINFFASTEKKNYFVPNSIQFSATADKFCRSFEKSYEKAGPASANKRPQSSHYQRKNSPNNLRSIEKDIEKLKQENHIVSQRLDNFIQQKYMERSQSTDQKKPPIFNLISNHQNQYSIKHLLEENQRMEKVVKKLNSKLEDRKKDLQRTFALLKDKDEEIERILSIKQTQNDVVLQLEEKFQYKFQILDDELRQKEEKLNGLQNLIKKIKEDNIRLRDENVLFQGKLVFLQEEKRGFEEKMNFLEEKEKAFKKSQSQMAILLNKKEQENQKLLKDLEARQKENFNKDEEKFRNLYAEMLNIKLEKKSLLANNLKLKEDKKAKEEKEKELILLLKIEKEKKNNDNNENELKEKILSKEKELLAKTKEFEEILKKYTELNQDKELCESKLRDKINENSNLAHKIKYLEDKNLEFILLLKNNESKNEIEILKEKIKNFEEKNRQLEELLNQEKNDSSKKILEMIEKEKVLLEKIKAQEDKQSFYEKEIDKLSRERENLTNIKLKNTFAEKDKNLLLKAEENNNLLNEKNHELEGKIELLGQERLFDLNKFNSALKEKEELNKKLEMKISTLENEKKELSKIFEEKLSMQEIFHKNEITKLNEKIVFLNQEKTDKIQLIEKKIIFTENEKNENFRKLEIFEKEKLDDIKMMSKLQKENESISKKLELIENEKSKNQKLFDEKISILESEKSKELKLHEEKIKNIENEYLVKIQRIEEEKTKIENEKKETENKIILIQKENLNNQLKINELKEEKASLLELNSSLETKISLTQSKHETTDNEKMKLLQDFSKLHTNFLSEVEKNQKEKEDFIQKILLLQKEITNQKKINEEASLQLLEKEKAISDLQKNFLEKEHESSKKINIYEKEIKELNAKNSFLTEKNEKFDNSSQTEDITKKISFNPENQNLSEKLHIALLEKSNIEAEKKSLEKQCLELSSQLNNPVKKEKKTMASSAKRSLEIDSPPPFSIQKVSSALMDSELDVNHYLEELNTTKNEMITLKIENSRLKETLETKVKKLDELQKKLDNIDREKQSLISKFLNEKQELITKMQEEQKLYALMQEKIKIELEQKLMESNRNGIIKTTTDRDKEIITYECEIQMPSTHRSIKEEVCKKGGIKTDVNQEVNEKHNIDEFEDKNSSGLFESLKINQKFKSKENISRKKMFSSMRHSLDMNIENRIKFRLKQARLLVKIYEHLFNDILNEEIVWEQYEEFFKDLDQRSIDHVKGILQKISDFLILIREKERNLMDKANKISILSITGNEDWDIKGPSIQFLNEVFYFIKILI